MITEEPKRKTARIEVVDALRGFAVMAILLVHSIEHFIYPVYPSSEMTPAWLAALDQGAFDFIFTLFAGKAYAIFALLFGFTFYIQQSNQAKKGKDFGPRFLWRLLLLTLFASLNSLFFPAGDVLLLFAVVGGSLFIVRNWSDKTVFIIALLFLLQPMEWFHYFASLINSNYALPDLGVGELYAYVGEVTKTGSWWEFFTTNITTGQKASLLWAVGAGRIFQTVGLFLLGYLIGRRELFVANKANTHFWIGVLIVAAVLFGPLFQFRNTLAASENLIVKGTVYTVFDMWQKFAFTAVLVASFVLLYYHSNLNRVLDKLKPYGRMSMTNYISQSFLGMLVFFPIGLHLAPYCGYFLSLLIGIVLFILQLTFCKWWLSHYRQGPLENLWHNLTWIKSDRPMRRNRLDK